SRRGPARTGEAVGPPRASPLQPTPGRIPPTLAHAGKVTAPYPERTSVTTGHVRPGGGGSGRNRAGGPAGLGSPPVDPPPSRCYIGPASRGARSRRCPFRPPLSGSSPGRG